MHNNHFLGLIALLFVVAMTLFLGPNFGGLALAIISLSGSILGLFFGKRVTLNYFGKILVLEGKKYQVYCLFLFVVGTIFLIQFIWVR